MRYPSTAKFIPANINKKFFVGTTPHLFSYRKLYTPVYRGIPVNYGGVTFCCKQDALRNLERMVREYHDYELICGEPLRILRQLAKEKYGDLLPDRAKFSKVEDNGLQLYILNEDKQLAGICWVSDLITRLFRERSVQV